VKLWPADKTGIIVALDTETSGLHPDDGHRVSTVSMAWRDDDGTLHTIALPFDQGLRGQQRGAQGVLALEPDVNLGRDVWDAMLLWLSKQWLVFHNAKFDLHMMRAGTRDWPGMDLSSRFIWDTMIASAVIHPRDEVGLKPIAERLNLTSGDERIWEERMKKWVADSRAMLKKIGAISAEDIKARNPRYDLAPWSIMEGYAKQDTRLTLLLHEWQLDWLHEDEMGARGNNHGNSAGLNTSAREVIDRKLEVCLGLYEMERTGVSWNYVKAESAANAAEKAVYDLDKSLVAMGVRRLTSAGMLKWLADNKAWEGDANDGARYTAGGSRSLDAQEVDRLLRYWGSHPAGATLTKALESWKKRHELDVAGNMWYRGYTDKLGADGRLRTSYRQLKTVTGRMSVERVNLQAMPREGQEIPGEGFVKVKQLIEAHPDYVLYNMDLSQAELRVGAKLANCRKMLELLENNRDLHGATATALFGGKITERFCVLANVRSGTWCPRTKDDASNDDEAKVWGVARQVGKTVTFSSLFRGGGAALARALGQQARIYLPESETKRWVDSWRNEYKEIVRAWSKYEYMAKSNGWVPLGGGPLEERSWLWGGSGRRLVEDYQGYNRAVQGGIALLNQGWIAQAGAVLRANPHAGRLVLNVHDSLVLEVSKSAKPGKEFPRIVEHIAEIGAQLGRDMFATKIVVDINAW
jgi:DNA polymerase I-like protein with 3'-5' exonuclease and polymerase domains